MWRRLVFLIIFVVILEGEEGVFMEVLEEIEEVEVLETMDIDSIIIEVIIGDLEVGNENEKFVVLIKKRSKF